MANYSLKEFISIPEFRDIINSGQAIIVPDSRISSVKSSRKYLDEKIRDSESPVYGINTGFGSLYTKNISSANLTKLQENLMKSHACGTGPEVPEEIVSIMLLLKVHGLSFGHSGVQWEVINRFIKFYNAGIHPVVYQYGSLGASGDLAPLAHLGLPLIGEGEVNFQGSKMSGAKVLDKLGMDPLTLKAKDGLSILNGTQFMSAYALWGILRSKDLLRWANIISSLSLDVFDGRIEPFLEEVHRLRAHKGQELVSGEIRNILEGSQLINQHKTHVQDPYSFRCVPQVHGASSDAIKHVENIVETEINSVTDNPLVYPETDQIISGGNFHGQPLALGLDYLTMAMAELGNISERRTYQLISGSRNLPNYLVANPGINSGLMIPHFTAAHMVSHNKQLATPSSVDSIPSSNGQEDHVSMGSTSALRCFQVIENVNSILAIELMTASQALQFKRPLQTSKILEELVNNFRKEVTFIEEDRILHEDIQKAEKFLKMNHF